MEKNRFIQKMIDGRIYIYDRKIDQITSNQREDSKIFARNCSNEIIDLCIEVTTMCNFHCINCFSNSIHSQSGIFIPIDKLKKIVKFYAPSVVRVCITGGEPLLHPFISDILEIPNEFNNCGFVLSTNASLHEEFDKTIVDNKWCVAISLHGNKRSHTKYTMSDSFETVVRRITKLSERGIVHICTVLHEDLSPSDIDWLYKFRDDVGAELIRFILPRKFGRYKLIKDTPLLTIIEESLDDKSIFIKRKSNTIFIEASGKQRFSN